METDAIQFGTPEAFYLFWVVPLLAIFAWWVERRRRAQTLRMAGARLAPRLAAEASPARRRLTWALAIGAVTLLLLALSRPQWGSQIVRVTREGLDVIVALDTSKSMLAVDAGMTSTRLARAKRKVRDLIEALQGDRIGLIAFAGTAHLACPLTTDYEAAKLFLEDVDVTSVPRGGTRLGDAIRRAVEAFTDKSGPHRALVVVTDGGDQDSDPVGAAREAYQKGVRIFAIGMGGDREVPIRLRDESGQFHYIKDAAGTVVTSRLRGDILMDVTLAAGGAYARATADLADIQLIYDDHISTLESRELEKAERNVPIEHFRWPLALAGALLVAGPLVRGRRRRSTES